MTPLASIDRLRRRYRSMSARDRRAIGMGVLILLPVLTWSAIVRPYVAALDGLNDRIATERALLEREREVLIESPTYAHRLETANRAMDRWDSRFIRSPNLAIAEAEMSSLVEARARESRVLLREVRATPAPPTSISPVGLLPIRMSVSGESDFQGLLELLDGLERDPLLLRVIGLSVDRAPAAGDDDDLDGPVPVEFVAIIEAFAPMDEDVSPAL